MIKFEKINVNNDKNSNVHNKKKGGVGQTETRDS